MARSHVMDPDEPTAALPEAPLLAGVLVVGLLAALAQAWALSVGPLHDFAGLLLWLSRAWWALVAVPALGLSFSHLPGVRSRARVALLWSLTQFATEPLAVRFALAAEADARAYCEAVAAWDASRRPPPPRGETRDLEELRLPGRELPRLLRSGYSVRYHFQLDRRAEGFMAYFPAATGARSFWQGWSEGRRWRWEPLMD